jgi:competence protein ComEC
MLVVLGVVAVVSLALVHRDEIRQRAEHALGRGMPSREAELVRGFVLGQDERIDEATVEDFRRSGLAHLLAVSGQNVALLALLAMPLLAALGMPLRTRLVWILGAIVVYVPLAGAGPSILRAGVMGGLSVLAMLAGRRTSRLYGLALAAMVTLAIDPRLATDIGWQLSFAAILGILALAAPLRRAIAARTRTSALGGVLADGAAMTIAASLATAPLIALHFEAVSTTTLLANLLALPAVAPAMWLGMLAAVTGQIPGFPVELLNTVNAPLLAYIAQIASWCGRPSWAYLDVRLDLAGLIASYAALIATALVAPWIWRRHRLAGLRRGRVDASAPFPVHMPVIGAVAGIAVLVIAWVGIGDGAEAASQHAGLRVSILDVGQGDAILLQPARAPAVLIDGGPQGAGLEAKLRAAGVEELGVAILSHEQSDHAGGIEELLGRLPVAKLGYARLSGALREDVEAAGTDPQRVATGTAIRSGALRIETLWPPRELLDAPLTGADPNSQSLVLLARWHDFSMLLTGDVEAEAVPLDPGPIDVLKVAHHGSEDAGLDTLLDRTHPRLAVISVGEDNPFGHPTPAALATLAAHGTPVLRTDSSGTVVLDVDRDSFGVGTAD